MFGALKYWSEFYAYYRGVLFINILSHNHDTDLLKLTLQKYHHSMLLLYISELQDDPDEIIKFLGRYLLLDEINHQQYKNGRQIPDTLINSRHGNSIKDLYKMLKQTTNIDLFLKECSTLDKLFIECGFYSK